MILLKKIIFLSINPSNEEYFSEFYWLEGSLNFEREMVVDVVYKSLKKIFPC